MNIFKGNYSEVKIGFVVENNVRKKVAYKLFYEVGVKQQQNEIIIGNHFKKLAQQDTSLKNHVSIPISNTITGILFPYLGTDLIEYIQSEKREDSVIIQLVKQSIKSLDKLHSIGYVHCDVKLENFVCDDEYVRLIDFGDSYYISAIDTPTRYVGTLQYMSINALSMRVLTTADDYASLCYAWLYTCVGDQMWYGCNQFANVLALKKAFNDVNLEDLSLYKEKTVFSKNKQQLNTNIEALKYFQKAIVICNDQLSQEQTVLVQKCLVDAIQTAMTCGYYLQCPSLQATPNVTGSLV